MNTELKLVESHDFINVYYKPDNPAVFEFGSAELSKITGDVSAYLQEVNSKNVWYFNRLFVSRELRNKGIATKLLDEVIRVADNRNMCIVCEVNAYGDMSQKELKILYKKFGFIEMPSGFLAYLPGSKNGLKINSRCKNAHYQKLHFRVDIPDRYDYVGNLYAQELQDGLLQHESEKRKMPVTVDGLCFNNDGKFINKGGTIHLSVGLENDTKDLHLKFATLKSVSVYRNYIFGEIKGDDRLAIYGDLFYKFENITERVQTYTIVYELKNGIREVTLHDLGDYGMILTTCDLGEKQ